MKNFILLTFFITVFSSISCNSNDQLFVPESTIICTKDKNIITEQLLTNYISADNYYILVFSDTECSFCELELNSMTLIIKKYPELKPILILSSSFPEIYLIHAAKKHTFIPTVLYKKNEMIRQNDLSSSTKYIIIDNKLSILCRSTIVNDVKIKKVLKRK